MSTRSHRSTVSTVPLFGLAFGVGLAMTAQACSGGPDASSNTSGLAGGSGSGSSCNIVNLANQNIGKTACGSNSLGSKAYGSSCTGNGGSPEYWCADFARWVWGNSGADVAGLNAAASSFATYGQAHGTFSGTPHVGDAVVFRNSKGVHHVAIVTQVNSNGTIESGSGDWGGSHGSEAHFATTSSVKLNPTYAGKIGTKMGTMSVAGFISPYGMSKSGASGCGLDAGLNDSSAPTDAGSSTEGGASGSDEGGTNEGGASEGGTAEGGMSEGGVGEGGDSDGGVSDGGDSDGSYAFLARGDSPRRGTIDLSGGGTQSVAFSWRDAPGIAPPADLWVEAAGRPILQVSSVGNAPFVRAQLDAVPIRANDEYRIVFAREATAITIDVVDASDTVILHVRVGDARYADIVLPPASWRASVDIDPE